MTINEFTKKKPSEIIENIKNSSGNSFININEDLNFENQKIIGIKDIHSWKGHKTTAGSKILENFCPTYDSEVVYLLEKNGFHIVGTLNMDEFAMGFSNKTSYFGEVDNAINSDYYSGGSSGGSAYAVAKGLIPIATGTDTGGSIRQPAAFNGIYGMKPTYGLISRYGTIAFASSFDTIGLLSNNIEDNAATLEILAQNDPKDQTNYVPENFEATSKINDEISNLKFAYIKEWMEVIEGTEEGNLLKKRIATLKKTGVTVEEVSIPTVNYSFELYMILAYTEASSNLSRYDGIKFGLNSPNNSFAKYRHNFGKEIKKRLVIGAYMSSLEEKDSFFTHAQKIRTKMKNQFAEVFKNYDIILGPVTLEEALKKGENLSSKKGYLSDLFLIPANLTGIPAMSAPLGFTQNNMPLGIQILADKYNEKIIYQVAKYFESMGE